MGANLAEMARIGLNVPAGLGLTGNACHAIIHIVDRHCTS
jgi:phosphoenolpyruvate synthase/pyruvate phosphate dikinase